ncbi:hypothetical protein SEVIR_2G261633v4 [Setaria viridis]
MVSSSTIKHQPSTSTPIPISSATNTLFIFCSAYIGQHSVGTPAATAYSTEFHPQCLTRTCRPPCAGARPPAAPRTQRRGPGPWSSPGNPPAEPAVGRLVLWGLNDPQEPLPGHLQAGGDLQELLLAVDAGAAEAEVHHAAVWLPVEPRQALVPPRCSALFPRTGRFDQLPDAEHGRHSPAAGGEARVAESSSRPRLQRLERVHEDAVGVVRQSSPPAQSGVVDVALQALAHLPAEVRRRDGRDPEELEGSVPKLSKACWDVSGHVRELEVDGESGSAGGVEGVGRHAELAGDVEGVEGEHVDDEGVHAPEREGAEEAAEAPVVRADEE